MASNACWMVSVPTWNSAAMAAALLTSPPGDQHLARCVLHPPFEDPSLALSQIPRHVGHPFERFVPATFELRDDDLGGLELPGDAQSSVADPELCRGIECRSCGNDLVEERLLDGVGTVDRDLRRNRRDAQQTVQACCERANRIVITAQSGTMEVVDHRHGAALGTCAGSGEVMVGSRIGAHTELCLVVGALGLEQGAEFARPCSSASITSIASCNAPQMYRLITVSDSVRVRSGPRGMCSSAVRPSRAASFGNDAANMALASCARTVVRRGSSTDMRSAHFENHRADTSGADRAVTRPASNSASIATESPWSAHSLNCVANSVMSTESLRLVGLGGARR